MAIVLAGFLGCTLICLQQADATSNIRLECLDEQQVFDLNGSYQLGAFYHYGDELSVRTHNFPNGKPWQEDVGIVVVPYLQDTQTGADYIFVSKKGKRFYLLYGGQQQHIGMMTDNPSWYPTVFLGPKLQGYDPTTSQAKLREFLESRDPTLEARQIIRPLLDVAVHPSGKYLIALAADELLETQYELIGRLLTTGQEKGTLHFLNIWPLLSEHANNYIDVRLKTPGGKHTIMFDYHPLGLVAPSPAPTPQPTAAPTSTPTVEPSTTATPQPTTVPTTAPTVTLDPTATPQPTAVPTVTPDPTATPKPTTTPPTVPTAAPTATPTMPPTATPTLTPTPTMPPTATPTLTPTPTMPPTATPTLTPTPTMTPSPTPTATPTLTPKPTITPTPARPVSINPGDVPYSSNAKLLIFDDQQTCETADLSQNDLRFYVYTAAMLTNIRDDACGWAVVAKGGQRLSRCTPCQEDGERLVYTMAAARQIAGKRQVLVIENSKYFSEAGRGVALQHALIEWLAGLKQAGHPVPLTLFLVQSDGAIEVLLRGEDLQRLPYQSDDDTVPSIVGAVMQHINFEGDGFQPLKNIALIGQRLSNEAVDRVLYITDSRMLPDPIDDSQVGTLLGWRLEDVSVKIVTHERCDRWSYKNLVQCQELPEQPSVDEVKAILTQWRQAQ